jgi:magnesium transporter
MTAPPELLYLLAGDAADLAQTLSTMRSADVADALNQLEPKAAATVLCALPFDLIVRVFDEPELESRAVLFKGLDAKRAAPVIEAMAADQQADLFRELAPAERTRLLKTLTPATRDTLTMLLSYKPDVAGGLMTTEYMAIPADWTVQRALERIKEVARGKETVYAVYVVDPTDQRLVHVVSLRDLMLADPGAAVRSVGPGTVPGPPLSVTPDVNREDVARLISKYNLLAVPVVDATNHVVGIVTVDDIIDAMIREQTKDLQQLGGVEALDEPYTQVGFTAMIRKRAGWLAALFLGEMLTATAMGYFEGEISKAVVLALFIPLIISSGGNSGSQATSLIIRAMALRELTLRDWWRVALRELPSGLALGSILGAIGFVRIILWQRLGWYDYGTHWLLVATTVSSALVGVVTFGSLTGSMLPFIFRRLGFDPASASAPFVATLVDVTGLVIYFSLAMIILHGTLL